MLEKFDPFHLLPAPPRPPAPACGQEAGPRTGLLLKVAERGGGRQVHGTRQWGCFNFRGRLNSSLSPLPPVIGDLAAEGGGGKGPGRPASEPPRHVGRCWVARGPTFGARLWRRRRGGSVWTWGRGAAEVLLSRPRSERHLTVPAALRWSGWGASGTGMPGPPRTKPAPRGRPPRPRPGNGPKPVAVPTPIPAAAAGVCLLVPRRLPRRMASCDRGDPQFPELSGGGSGSGSRARSGLLAAAPTSPPFSPSARPGPAVPPGRAAGRGPARPFPAALVASGREGSFDLPLGPSGLVRRRRRGGRSGGGGRPLSNGEGGGGHVAAERAALGCAGRRCHRCTRANSGEGAGSYFPLLPRCCFCRLGRRTAREGGRRRCRGPARIPAGGRALRGEHPVQGGGRTPTPGRP